MSAERFRVIARVIILTPDRRVVLVTSRAGKALVLPGGTVDTGESLPHAAIREAKEECGVEVVIGQAIWLREFVEPRGQASLEVYFLGRPAQGTALPDRWEHVDEANPQITRKAGLYSRDDFKTIDLPVFPDELREAFWMGLDKGYAEAYLGRFKA
jgi:8-oxo-dGTP pyrophosphatase MutT (NUDIX family)